MLLLLFQITGYFFVAKEAFYIPEKMVGMVDRKCSTWLVECAIYKKEKLSDKEREQ